MQPNPFSLLTQRMLVTCLKCLFAINSLKNYLLFFLSHPVFQDGAGETKIIIFKRSCLGLLKVKDFNLCKMNCPTCSDVKVQFQVLHPLVWWGLPLLCE